jgi:hypothetical protein
MSAPTVTSTVMLGRRLEELAAQMVAAAEEYRPEEMRAYVEDLRSLPQVVELLAAAVEAMAERAGADLPVPHGVTEGIRALVEDLRALPVIERAIAAVEVAAGRERAALWVTDRRIGQELQDVRATISAAQLALDAACLAEEVALARVLVALSELPPGTVVEAEEGQTWRRATDGRWTPDEGGPATTGALADLGPFTVIRPADTTR